MRNYFWQGLFIGGVKLGVKEEDRQLHFNHRAEVIVERLTREKRSHRFRLLNFKSSSAMLTSELIERVRAYLCWRLHQYSEFLNEVSIHADAMLLGSIFRISHVSSHRWAGPLKCISRKQHVSYQRLDGRLAHESDKKELFNIRGWNCSQGRKSQKEFPKSRRLIWILRATIFLQGTLRFFLKLLDHWRGCQSDGIWNIKNELKMHQNSKFDGYADREHNL